MLYERVRALFLLAVAAGCLVVGSLLQPAMTRVRADFALHEDVLAQMPPELVIATTALGGFRGLLVDAVWLRARKLEIDGKFWELVQLYDWIGKLEPHLDRIWAYNAWNMAYNVVAQLKNSEERWQWIWRAIETLRDQGLKYNPRSVEIYRELSWIFFQKISRETDEHQLYYKHRLALHVMEKLQIPAVPVLNVERLAEAPLTRDELNRQLLAEEGERLRWFFGVADNVREFDVVQAYLDARQDRTKIPPERRRRGNEPAFANIWRRIQDFLLAERLRTHFGLDPRKMLQLEKEYGQMDWRLPDPHAIYWATLGLERSQNLDLKERIKLHRIILFSLCQLYRQGAITYMDNDPYGDIIFTYNLRYVDPVDRLYRKLIDEYKNPKGKDAIDFSDSLRDGHMYHLQESLFLLYFAGLQKDAERYLKMLQRDYPSDRWKDLSLEEYIYGQIKKMVEEWGTYAQVRNLIDNLLVQTLINLAVGRTDLAVMYEAFAKRAYLWFREDFVMHRQDRGTDARMIPTWEEVYREVTLSALEGKYPSIPPYLVSRLREIVKPPEPPKKPEEKERLAP